MIEYLEPNDHACHCLMRGLRGELSDQHFVEVVGNVLEHHQVSVVSPILKKVIDWITSHCKYHLEEGV
jgi:hypothetical protein